MLKDTEDPIAVSPCIDTMISEQEQRQQLKSQFAVLLLRTQKHQEVNKEDKYSACRQIGEWSPYQVFFQFGV